MTARLAMWPPVEHISNPNSSSDTPELAGIQPWCTSHLSMARVSTVPWVKLLAATKEYVLLSLPLVPVAHSAQCRPATFGRATMLHWAILAEDCHFGCGGVRADAVPQIITAAAGTTSKLLIRQNNPMLLC